MTSELFANSDSDLAESAFRLSSRRTHIQYDESCVIHVAGLPSVLKLESCPIGPAPLSSKLSYSDLIVLKSSPSRTITWDVLSVEEDGNGGGDEAGAGMERS